MRMTPVVLAALLLALSPLPRAWGAEPAAEPPVEAAARWVADHFRPQEGFVVTIADRTVFTSLGASTSLPVGAELAIVRDGEPILHPLTRRVLGRQELPVGVLVATKVSTDYVSGELWPQPGQEARVGDRVRISAMPHRLAVIPPGTTGASAEWYRPLVGALGKQGVVPVEIAPDKPVELGTPGAGTSDLAARHGAAAILRVTAGADTASPGRLELFSGRTGRLMGTYDIGPPRKS